MDDNIYYDRSMMPPVEEFIRNQVWIDYGEYQGVYKMTKEDLIMLKCLIEAQLQNME